MTVEMFTEYEQRVIKEIAQHRVEPSALDTLFCKMGKPMELIFNRIQRLDNKLTKKITSSILEGVDKGIRKSVTVANTLCSDQSVLKEYQKKSVAIDSLTELNKVPLNMKDRVADSYDVSNAIFVGLEGALLAAATTLCEGTGIGAFLIPSLVVTDVVSSTTLLTRHVCQIATSYGYSSQDPVNLPHILAAMAPQHHGDERSFLTLKSTAYKTAHESKQFLRNNVGKVFSDRILSQEAPGLLKLINAITQRINVVITEKELAMLAPVAGIIINSGVNVAFQQMGHTTAKDYFRYLVLENKYGEKVVDMAVSVETEYLRSFR